jgi:Xaa-Pro aminopeptidase
VIDSVLNGYRPGGKGIFYVEDDVLITEKGPEILTPVPHELNIV